VTTHKLFASTGRTYALLQSLQRWISLSTCGMARHGNQQRQQVTLNARMPFVVHNQSERNGPAWWRKMCGCAHELLSVWVHGHPWMEVCCCSTHHCICHSALSCCHGTPHKRWQSFSAEHNSRKPVKHASITMLGDCSCAEGRNSLGHISAHLVFSDHHLCHTHADRADQHGSSS
jgi:hypothetical protein